ncbi:SRPBCC domain-containing protein [Streptomyces sp. Ru87]|uniref:SRPBCC family protein n=1 Tax=Streptomyces sp. Ru87 TaxID=2044307 RepID=UPI000BF41DFB|nr:SRPBCC domain-containing protein [Streptomyces sp. Ru87]PGH49574.1 hypothetical protein CRI70_16895 [Streptomyces sp. Ru87]
MEHEVFVPFSAETVRQALADPARVARCVPGLQRDAVGAADAPGTLTGRMRIRAGSSTITYRGTLRVEPRSGGELAVEGEGAEARGDGSAKLALTVRLRAADGGTALVCAGTVLSEGRLAEVDARSAATAGRRLLDRFAGALAADLEAKPTGREPAAPGIPAPETGTDDRDTGRDDRDTGRDEAVIGRPDDNEPAIPGIPSPEQAPDASPAPGEPSGAAAPGKDVPGKDVPQERRSQDDGGEGTAPGQGKDGKDGKGGKADRAGKRDTGKNGAGEDADAEPDAPAASEPAASPSVFDTEVPPPSLDPLADEVSELIDEPPAEAAHARRTMIGRSAEEVDHAPPRGRYAPLPAPQPASPGDTLRWAAPAAAALIASAVVISRIVRRRR